MKIYNNPNNLSNFVIIYRLLDADPSVSVSQLSVADRPKINPKTGAPLNLNYIQIETILTDAQITTALATPATPAENAAYALWVGARAELKAIPNWATHTQAEALAWGTTNIGTPLSTARSSLPGTLTLATAKTAILNILNVLDKMYTLQVAIIRMLIALRNKVF